MIDELHVWVFIYINAALRLIFVARPSRAHKFKVSGTVTAL